MVDVNRLRIMRAVVAAGSISSAAEALRYTPSAVSQHISALQRETRLVLFEKSGRGLRPTSAARQLVEGSDELMASLARVDDLVESLRVGRTGSVTIATFASSGEHWLPEVVARLRDEFPDTQWSVVLADAVADERADMVIVTEDPSREAASRPGHTRVELTLEPYVVLLRKDHPLAAAQQIEAADLADEQWIRDDFADSVCSTISNNAWRAAGFTPRSVVQAADHHGAAQFVEAGLGICVMPRLAAQRLPAGVVRRPVVNPTPARRIVLFVHDSIAGNPAARRATELLRARAVPTASSPQSFAVAAPST